MRAEVAARGVFPEDYVQIERDPRTPAGRGHATFTLSGEIDIENVDRLVRAVLPDAVRGAHLVLDLSRLEFIDCSGVRALIEILHAIGPDGSLTIRRPSPPVRRVLALVGADRFKGLVIADS